ncbi:MAG: hypothetical protein ACT4OF_07245 [Caulobacteraceae bacterium]
MPATIKYKCLKCTADFELLIWQPEEQEAEERRKPTSWKAPQCKYCNSREVIEAGALSR